MDLMRDLSIRDADFYATVLTRKSVNKEKNIHLKSNFQKRKIII